MGAPSGALGAALKARQNVRVVGVEIDAAYAEDAKSRLDQVLCENLDDIGRWDELETAIGRFDCVIAGDVLEHLVDPWTALRRVGELLDPGGLVIVSLPNVRYWETLWQLAVRGRWPRRDAGLFDRTHLRWFTFRDAHDLLSQAGMVLEGFESRNHVLPTASKLDRVAWASRRLRRLLHPFFAYQYLLVGRKPKESCELQ